MEHAKSANGRRHQSTIGRSLSQAEQDQKGAARAAINRVLRQKTEPRKAKPTRPLRKELDGKPKSDKLVSGFFGRCRSRRLCLEQRNGCCGSPLCTAAQRDSMSNGYARFCSRPGCVPQDPFVKRMRIDQLRSSRSRRHHKKTSLRG